MKTIIHIVGNRPQFVKLAVLYKELQSQHFNQQIIHTGQHFSYNMSEVFFTQLQIPIPDINLHISNKSAALFIGEAMELLYNLFEKTPNAIIFVYGDTNTTLAAAIAAKKANLPLVHFEAGVRTNDLSMPEEINRIITDRLADINFCCTQKNFDLMQQESYGKAIASKIFLIGDLMFDAFLKINAAKENCTTISNYWACTIHRAGNILDKEKLANIINGLNKINTITPVIMPVHPHTQKNIIAFNLQPSFKIISPLGYPEMKLFLSKSIGVITDSGGTSREAYFLQKKSLIIMDNPFWPEIIEANCALSSTSNTNDILKKFKMLTDIKPNFNNPIFGNGNAAKKIATHLNNYINSL